jgi:hypothetical protein
MEVLERRVVKDFMLPTPLPIMLFVASYPLAEGQPER